ncbi:MAG: hypothetical protein ACP6IP_00195 [Candidatus Njordarchaeia archaeon]
MNKGKKILGFLSKAARKLLPVAAGILTGVVAPPLVGIVAGHISVRLREFRIEVDKTQLVEAANSIMRKESIERVNEQIEQLIFKTGEKRREEVKAAVEYALRDLFHDLRDSIEHLKGHPEEITLHLEEMKIDIVEIKDELKETRRIIEEKAELQIVEIKNTMLHLDKMFLDIAKQMAKKEISPEEIKTLSLLQIQNVTKSSKFDMGYREDLYINRVDAETNFENFRNNMEYAIGRKRNVFLVLADAGMGKTWLTAHVAKKLVREGEIAFYFPLRNGLEQQLGQIFRKPIGEIKNILRGIYEKTGKLTYLFLDGLDEVDGDEIRKVLNNIIPMKNDEAIAIILSCRTIDWVQSTEIREKYGELEKTIYNAEEDPRIETPISAKLTEFTDKEIDAASHRYGIPKLEGELRELARKPYILKLIAEWIWEKERPPSLENEEEMIEFVAGKTKSILARMNITGITKENFYKIAEKILENPSRETLLESAIEGIPLKNWIIIASSGLVKIEEEPYGVTVKINPTIEKAIKKLVQIRKEKKKKPKTHTKPLEQLEQTVKKCGGTTQTTENAEGTSAKINLYNTETDPEKIKNIAETLKQTNLNKLELNLWNNKISDKGTENLANAISQQTNLNQLEIHFENNAISDAGAIYLAEALGNLTNLNQLELHLLGNSISHIGAQHISEALSKLTNLNKLAVGLGKNIIGDAGAIYLAEALGNLTNLNQLEVYIWSNSITSTGAKHIAETLNKLTKLTQLTVDLGRENIGDAGAIHLAEALNRLTSLTQLRINLGGSSIGETGAIYLAEALGNLTNLNQLEVVLWGNSITEIKHLTQAINKLKNLNQLTLTLSVNSINDEGAENLANTLTKQKNLNQLKIELDQNKITNTGAEHLTKAIKNLTNLTQLEINLAENPINEIGAKTLETIKNHHPHAKITT